MSSGNKGTQPTPEDNNILGKQDLTVWHLSDEADMMQEKNRGQHKQSGQVQGQE